MNTIFPSIPVRYFAILCEFLDSIQVRSDDILRVAGLDRSKLDLSGQAITASQMELLLREARRVSGREDLAFELGNRIKPNSHDILSLALISSTSLDHMLQLYSRYYRLITPLFRMHYRRDGDHAELAFMPAMPMTPAILKYCLETTAVGAYMQIKSALQIRPGSFDVHVPMDAPPHLARYRNLHLANFHFSASATPEVRIRIKDAHLDAVLPMANAQAVKLAEERCDAILSHVGEKASWSDWVCMMLKQHAEDSQPTMVDLAKILNVTPRTLDRYLHKENTSFRDLSVRIRNQRARQLLDEGRMSVSQIAYTLGYTDHANFSRSFKKVSGLSPRAYQDVSRSKLDRQAA